MRNSVAEFRFSIIGGGAGAGNPVASSVPNAPAIGWTALVQGAALAFYAFIGFEDIVNVAEEVKNPERNVPKAILFALGIAGVVYVLVSWLATNVLSPAELAGSNAPLLDRVVIELAALLKGTNWIE